MNKVLQEYTILFEIGLCKDYLLSPLTLTYTLIWPVLTAVKIPQMALFSFKFDNFWHLHNDSNDDQLSSNIFRWIWLLRFRVLGKTWHECEILDFFPHKQML